LQTLQQSLEEPLCSVRITPGPNQDVAHNTILIDGAPEIVLHTLGPNEHLVEVRRISWSWPAAAQAIGESHAEFLAPASHGFVGDDDAALSQGQLVIARAVAGHLVQPDGMTDDPGWEPMTIVGVGWRLQTASIARRPADCQLRLPYTAQRPNMDFVRSNLIPTRHRRKFSAAPDYDYASIPCRRDKV
jgi:hypothetical protein